MKRRALVPAVAFLLILALAGTAGAYLAPLKKTMINFLSLMQSLLSSVAAEDYDTAGLHALGLAKAAAAWEGDQAEQPFPFFMGSVKVAAEKMLKASQQRNGALLIQAYGEALAACSGCHTRLRKQ